VQTCTDTFFRDAVICTCTDDRSCTLSYIRRTMSGGAVSRHTDQQQHQPAASDQRSRPRFSAWTSTDTDTAATTDLGLTCTQRYTAHHYRPTSVLPLDAIVSLLRPILQIHIKNCWLSIVLTVTDKKLQKNH